MQLLSSFRLSTNFIRPIQRYTVLTRHFARKRRRRMKNKTKEKSTEKAILGRRSGNVKVGLVGLPNVGKTSLFNLLSGLNKPALNYPFCTIDPSTALVPVLDQRFDKLCEIWKPKKVRPGILSVTDIAGLVRGAHEGKGLGNSFLSNIGQVDAIFHLVRGFQNETIQHVEGNVDPIRDIEIIRQELLQRDVKLMKTQVEILTKKCGSNRELWENAFETAKKVLSLLQHNIEVRRNEWNLEEVNYLNTLQLLTAKRVVYLLNQDGDEDEHSQQVSDLRGWVAENDPGASVIPFSVEWEEECAEPCEKTGRDYSANSLLAHVIRSGARALQLVHFFTTGSDEVACWSVRENTTVAVAAGTIHSDFEKNFIKCESYPFDELKKFNYSEQRLLKAGKRRAYGKDHIMTNGDIVVFRHSARGS